MSLEFLYGAATLLVAISLAAERAVAIVKSLVPSWFAGPTAGAVADDRSERWRQLRVQLTAVVTGWVTAAFLVPGGFDLFGTIALVPEAKLPVLLVGLLCSGGSAFWSSVLGWVTATKDVQKAQASHP